MLRKIRGLLKTTDDYEEYTQAVVSSMDYISASLVKHFSGPHYGWTANERIKTFECLVLSKFLLDYSLSRREGISEDKRRFYLSLTDTAFEESLRDRFPWLRAAEAVKAKLEVYSDIMAEASPPECWQLIAGACTEIDYSSKQDEPTLIASSLVLPALLQFADNLWERLG